MLTPANARRRRPAPTANLGLRTSILKAARGVLLTDGAGAITARRVAADARCSPTAIYIYFKNLDDLLFALRIEGHAILARYLAVALRPGPIWERLRKMGRAYFSFGVENPAYYDLMFLSRRNPLPKRPEVQKETYTLMMLHELIVAGAEKGDIRGEINLMVATNAVWAQVHGVTSLAVEGMLTHTAPRGNREILEAVLESIESWLRP